MPELYLGTGSVGLIFAACLKDQGFSAETHG